MSTGSSPVVIVSCHCQLSSSAVPKGFTIIELLIVIAVMGLLAGIVSIPLSTLQTQTAMRDAAVTMVDTFRRAQTQAMSGHYGDKWGVHVSDSDGCFLPATKAWIFRGDSFSSASDTVDVIELPDASLITAVSVGGGCDVKFSRFDGSTTSTGTITVSDLSGATNTVSINAYGRISNP